MSIVSNTVLRDRAEELLLDDISPETTAGRIKKESKGTLCTSKNTLYRYIASVYGRRIEYQRSKSKYRNRSKITLVQLQDRVHVSKRPVQAEYRSRYGHAEGDFIVSGTGGSGILLVVVDRKIRKSFLRKIYPVSIENVHRGFLSIQQEYPDMKTITLDNDILFRKHKILEQLLCVRIYFCTPYHSWEKGTVENTNRYIRRYIKKRSDISQYSDEYIQTVQDRLNRRPMKCLDYNTPDEEYATYIQRVHKKSS
jgi:transposase, IS30 family